MTYAPIDINIPIEINAGSFGTVLTVQGETVHYNKIHIPLMYKTVSTDPTFEDVAKTIRWMEDPSDQAQVKVEIADTAVGTYANGTALLTYLFQSALESGELYNIGLESGCIYSDGASRNTVENPLNFYVDRDTHVNGNIEGGTMKSYLQEYLYDNLSAAIGLAATTGDININMSRDNLTAAQIISAALANEICADTVSAKAIRQSIYEQMFTLAPERFVESELRREEPAADGTFKYLPFSPNDTLAFLVTFKFPKSLITHTSADAVLNTTNDTIEAVSTPAISPIFNNFPDCTAMIRVKLSPQIHEIIQNLNGLVGVDPTTAIVESVRLAEIGSTAIDLNSILDLSTVQPENQKDVRQNLVDLIFLETDINSFLVNSADLGISLPEPIVLKAVNDARVRYIDLVTEVTPTQGVYVNLRTIGDTIIFLHHEDMFYVVKVDATTYEYRNGKVVTQYAEGSHFDYFYYRIVLGSVVATLLPGSDSSVLAPSFSYVGPKTFSTGVQISSVSPINTGGAVSSYEITPQLPSGLSFHTTTGVISGTPSAILSLTTFTITGTNQYGSSSATLNISVIFGVPQISYPSSRMFTVGVQISTITPTNTGAAANFFTIDKSVPSGLTFNTTTGQISGTPLETSPSTVYTITANNSAGSSSTTFTFGVNPAAPNISYNGPQVYFISEAIIDLVPSNTGGVASWSITPSLPAGLTFNSNTGVISGTPTSQSSLTTYTITATNVTGTSNATLNITVNPLAPVISYGGAKTFTIGTAVSITPTNTGGSATSWSISPSLPTGLALDESTGVISGTPTSQSSLTTYTITASNLTGASDATLNITVNPLAPVISYGGAKTFTIGTAVSVTPTNTGGSASSWSISPSLPAGLLFNTSTGVISGTPTSQSSLTTYTITATNVTGSSNVTLNITVMVAVPVISYSSSTLTKDVQVYIEPVVVGTVTSWSISPSLSTGLTFNTSTGVISGTPMFAEALTTYTITATNQAGSANATISLSVIIEAPSISYADTQFIIGIADTKTPVNTKSLANSWSISPTSLPFGLTFDTTTGVISGTGAVVTAAQSYVVTATNSVGSGSVTISLEVVNIPPNIVYDSSTLSVKWGTAVSLTPTNSGGVTTSYSVSPTLPAGLTFNIVTGTITGEPSAVKAATNYTITATNSAGSSSFVLNLAIILPDLPTFNYNNGATPYTMNVFNDASLTLEPTLTGGKVASWSCSGTLANFGLTFTKGTFTGIISGTVASTTYKVTATNPAGSYVFDIVFTRITVATPVTSSGTLSTTTYLRQYPISSDIANVSTSLFDIKEKGVIITKTPCAIPSIPVPSSYMPTSDNSTFMKIVDTSTSTLYVTHDLLGIDTFSLFGENDALGDYYVMPYLLFTNNLLYINKYTITYDTSMNQTGVTYANKISILDKPTTSYTFPLVIDDTTINVSYTLSMATLRISYMYRSTLAWGGNTVLFTPSFYDILDSNTSTFNIPSSLQNPITYQTTTLSKTRSGISAGQELYFKPLLQFAGGLYLMNAVQYYSSGVNSLFKFSGNTFTGLTGPTLPTLQNALTNYSTTKFINTSYFTVTNGIQLLTIPDNGYYEIVASGGKGGSTSFPGQPATASGKFYLTKGDQLGILVGQNGLTVSGTSYGGGGGASFVYITNSTGNAIGLIVAAGGAGGFTTSPGFTFGGYNAYEKYSGNTSIHSSITNSTPGTSVTTGTGGFGMGQNGVSGQSGGGGGYNVGQSTNSGGGYGGSCINYGDENSIYISSTVAGSYVTIKRIPDMHNYYNRMLGGIARYVESTGFTNVSYDVVYTPSGEIYVTASAASKSAIYKWTDATSKWIPIMPFTTSGFCYAIAVGLDGILYAGGTFTSVNGVSASRIAKWNGTSWSPLGTGLGGTCNAITVGPDGSVYAGGSFTTAGGISAIRIAKWDGTSWSAIGGGLDGTCSTIAIGYDGKLFAGGSFLNAGGIPANRIAQWDGTTWSPLGTGLINTCNKITIGPDGSLYAGGTFTNGGGVTGASRIAKWNGTAWSALGTGISSVCNDIAFASDGTLYAAGNLTTASGTTVTHIAVWNGISWSAFTTNPYNSAAINAIAIGPDGSIVFAGTDVYRYIF